MIQSGLTYFRLDTCYNGDYTKGCSLKGEEIDANFHFLRGMDIVQGFYDKDGLHLKTLGDDCIDIPFNNDMFSASTVNFYGTAYDAANGILDLHVNGENFTISGFSVCDCEALWQAVSGLSSEIQCLSNNVDFQISALTEDFQAFRDSLENITVSGSSVNIVGAVLTLKTTVESHAKDIANLKKKSQDNSDSIQSLQTSAKTLDTKLNELDHKLSQNETTINQEIKQIDNKLNEEIIRATNSESAISEKIDTVSKDISDNVKSKLDEQQKDIQNVSANVSKTLDFAQSALTYAQAHTMGDVVFEEKNDRLCLKYVHDTHYTDGVSLAKYNVYGDNSTIIKNGDVLSVITDKTDGAVSYNLFMQHLNDYQNLLSQYNSLKKEFDSLKNAKKYYMGIVSDKIVDVLNKINLDYILQRQFLIDINKKNNSGYIISTEGAYLMVAVPKDETFKVTDEGNISYDSDLQKIDTICNYENIEYDIYSTENGDLAPGTKYILNLN